MTHTLHRQTDLYNNEPLICDIVFLSMAAQGKNSFGAKEKLKSVFEILQKQPHVNLADDNQGGVLTGITEKEILAKATDKAYIGAVFTEYNALQNVLIELKEKNLGMSVVISGNFKSIFEVLKKVGLKPHTVNMSLGVFGKKELLESEEILAITSMCGHGMISPDSVKRLFAEIRKGRFSAEEASLELAKGCTCGIFNPKLAEKIFQQAIERNEDHDH